MTKLSVEVDQLESIKNQIETLLGKASKSPIINQYEMISESDLSEKEKMIIDYVKKNPGTTKQGVVSGLRGRYSRGPVFKAIEDLQKYGIIVVRKDTTNPQIHHLYINDESLLLSTAQELERVRNSFFVLIDKVKSKQGKWKDNEDYNYIIPITIMYAHLIVIHNISSIFIWPKKTKDREILQRLYIIGLARIQEIQSKLLDIRLDMNILSSVLIHLFVLNPEKLEAVYDELCRYKIDKEGESVLDSLWHISHPLVPIFIKTRLSKYTYESEEREQILKMSDDWRELVKMVQNMWKRGEEARKRHQRRPGDKLYRINVPWPRLSP